MARKSADPKKVSRYTYPAATDPATPETGHTSLIGDERTVGLEMDNGWSQAIEVGKLPNGHIPVIIDMEPAYDPVLFWAGKRNRRDVQLLPLQRNEIVSVSRIARIITRAREAAANNEASHQASFGFAELEKTIREGDKDKRIEFYTHDEGWKNKLICGDSLEVMESLIGYEDLRGKVQMIYVDPPYGIKYDANFQQSVDSIRNDPRDLADDVLTIRAYNDTWLLGIHSYLSYLAERLYLCRELLTDRGSIFVQIGEDNVHLVRALMGEIFGAKQFMSQIAFSKTTGLASTKRLTTRCDYLIWYAKNIESAVYQPLYELQDPDESGYNRVELPSGERRAMEKGERTGAVLLPKGSKRYMADNLTKPGPGAKYEITVGGVSYNSGNRWWGMPKEALERLVAKGRVEVVGKTPRYVRYFDDFPYKSISNLWTGFAGASNPSFVVQTNEEIVARCIAMTTRPGDLVLDPTCGAGTTARAAERLGRRWITCDTSRVAVNVARRELLSAVFEHYITVNGSPSSGMVYQTATRTEPTTVAYDREPETLDLLDRPKGDPGATRVCGPFEIMTLGRYSAADWSGYMTSDEGAAGKLENYIAVMCRLYRKDAALQASAGVIHAIEDSAAGLLAISVGPVSGRVTARQIYDAAKEAEALEIPDVHVMGWAFEANVGEVKSEIEARGEVAIHLVMIRPDTLAEGLKITNRDTLFSPLALPDVDVRVTDDKYSVTLNGVGLFDRKHAVTEFKRADSGYIAAWYLDEDYDGDCFVDCQMFFDFKRKPAIEQTLRIQVDPEEWTMRLTSDTFASGKHQQIAVKVVDVYGNESTVVKSLS